MRSQIPCWISPVVTRMGYLGFDGSLTHSPGFGWREAVEEFLAEDRCFCGIDWGRLTNELFCRKRGVFLGFVPPLPRVFLNLICVPLILLGEMCVLNSVGFWQLASNDHRNCESQRTGAKLGLGIIQLLQSWKSPNTHPG